MPNLFRGVVTKTGAMAKTVTVTVNRNVEHPKLLKTLHRTTKFLVHDENEITRIGDKVTILHGKPFSKRKHYRVAEIHTPLGPAPVGRTEKEQVLLDEKRIQEMALETLHAAKNQRMREAADKVRTANPDATPREIHEARRAVRAWGADYKTALNAALDEARAKVEAERATRLAK